MSVHKDVTEILDILKTKLTENEEIKLIDVLKKNIEQGNIESGILDNLLNDEQTGICLIDLNKRVILFNKAAEMITGFSQEEVLGNQIMLNFFISEVFFNEVLSHLSKNSKTPIAKNKMIITAKNNIQKHIKLSSKLLYNNANEIYAIQFHFFDITEEDNKITKLNKYNSIFKTLLNESDDMFFAKDEHLKYFFMNNNYLEYNKLEHNNIIGKLDSEIFPADMAKIFIESDLQILSHKKKFVLENFKNDNQVFSVKKIPVTDNKKTIGLGGIIRNQTDLIKIEDDLKLLITAIKQIQEGILITDADATILYVNDGYQKICGYSSDELIGKKPSILKSGKMSDEFYHLMWNNLKQGKSWDNTFINRRKNGDFYEESVIINPVKDSYGNIINYISIKKDVTEENIIKKKLQHTAKLESLGTLAGGIAHDFNNILSIIMGYTELLKDSMADNTESLSDLEEIRNASNRAKEIISQILLFSKQKESSKTILKVKDIFSQSERTIKSTIPVNITLIYKNMSKGSIFMDPSHIIQLMLNLTSNSVQAIDNNDGIIQVIIKDIDNAVLQTRNISSEDSNKYLKIQFIDNGKGISELDLPKIFDPYFTTKEIGENTGLGLSVIDGIIRSVNGFIDVKSQIGVGTEFTIYIPLVENEQNIKEEPETLLDLPKNLNVLLVDDESSIVYAISKILTKHGFTVYGFQEPELAIEHYYNNRENINLIITDYLIPRKNGIEIIQNIRNINPLIPCIVISGNLKALFDAHPDCPKDKIIYLDKPFDSITLLKAIDKIIDKE